MEEMLLTYHEGEDGMFYPDLELPVEKVSMTELTWWRPRRPSHYWVRDTKVMVHTLRT